MGVRFQRLSSARLCFAIASIFGDIIAKWLTIVKLDSRERYVERGRGSRFRFRGRGGGE